VLASYPALAAELKPEREGVKAEWFEHVRKSERQLYRVLGNTHYAHLVELLEALDSCLTHGYKQPRLLRTRARSSFAPDLAELRVAEHFALANCAIAGFDYSKGGESVPDLVATTRDGFRVAVEAYCPMAFEHLDGFRDDLISAIKNIDLPFDLSFRLSFHQLHHFDDDQRLLYLQAGPLDEALRDGALGKTVAREFISELAERLDNPPSTISISREEPDLNLVLVLELERIEQTPDRLPAREGVISGPNTSPPNPEWVVAQVASQAEAKAAEGQALRVAADAAVLVVDLTESDIPSELRSEIYRKKFLEILKPRADKALRGHTAIVFAESAGWHKPFIPRFLNTAESAPATLRELLDPRGIARGTNLPRPRES
jgi:hypothetical protein